MAVPARHTSKAKKNKRNTPDRLQLKKYSPKLRKHVIFTEVK